MLWLLLSGHQSIHQCLSMFVDTSITITRVTEADAGVYQCIANNVVGSAYATSVLTVTASRQRHTLTTQSTAAAGVSSPQPSRMCLLHQYCPLRAGIPRLSCSISVRGNQTCTGICGPGLESLVHENSNWPNWSDTKASSQDHLQLH